MRTTQPRAPNSPPTTPPATEWCEDEVACGVCDDSDPDAVVETGTSGAFVGECDAVCDFVRERVLLFDLDLEVVAVGGWSSATEVVVDASESEFSARHLLYCEHLQRLTRDPCAAVRTAREAAQAAAARGVLGTCSWPFTSLQNETSFCRA